MKTGLIGNGYWGKIVAEKLKVLSELKFTADSKTNLNDVINDVDMVFICTPTNTHYDIIKYCLQKNKHIFCEKPFTGSYDKSIELLNIAKNQNLKIIVDHVFLHRNEYKDTFNGNNFKFIWNKPEIIKQNIFDSLLYHDLYLLINITNCVEWNVLEKNVSDEKLFLKLNSNNKSVEINYNRNCNYKEKKILIDDKIIDFSEQKNDALFDMIKLILNNKYNIIDNNNLCMSTLKLKYDILNN